MFKCLRLPACSNKYILGFCMLWAVVLLVFYAQEGTRLLSLPRKLFVSKQHISKDATLRNFKDDVFVNFTDHLPEKPKQECIHPKLEIKDPIMMKFLKKIAYPKCQGTDWIYVENGTVRFKQIAELKGQNFTCDYYPLIREDDKKSKWGTPVKNIKDGFKMTSDFFKAVCKSSSNKTYERVHSGVAYLPERADRKEEPLASGLEGLSIGILGFDSMSRMSWLRRLTKTRAYFHDQLGAIELEDHNVVGDGTTAVMLPMLTGKFEWELPECRTNFKGTAEMDNFPFIWHDLKKVGYLTSWCNGAPHSAPFNWRMTGFKGKPTDFYTRPFYQQVTPYYKQYTKYCIGEQRQSRVWLNYFRDVFLMYKNKRKFLFHFITEFSHDDNNLMTMLDEDIKETVQFLYDNNYLNNTLLILMGDHGARYSYVRSTWSGKQEERLPYFSFLFPKWFEQKYPQAIANLRTNAKRLTTPFDLHETFKDFIHFGGAGVGNISERGISLFKEIPLDRTCESAGIANHWCACLAWKNSSFSDPGVKQALQKTLDTINGYTAEYRNDCALLTVDNVTMATKLETRSEVLHFKHQDANKLDKGVDLTAKGVNAMTLYQLTFYTTPGAGHFEVTVTHDLVNKKLQVSEKEISRINKYGNDPACILEKNKQIRQYCYCKNNIKS